MSSTEICTKGLFCNERVVCKFEIVFRLNIKRKIPIISPILLVFLMLSPIIGFNTVHGEFDLYVFLGNLSF